MQGVSINIFIKKGQQKADEIRKVFQFDLQGNREKKYRFLNDSSLSSIKWKQLELRQPDFYFAKKDFKGSTFYEKGFKIDKLFTAIFPE